MPSEVKRIGANDVALTAGNKDVSIPNDAVIIQIGGTAPAELLKKFGIEVVTKRGEA
jgi:thioredoxin reductase